MTQRCPRAFGFVFVLALTVPLTAGPAAAVQVQPHRAIYDLELASLRSGAAVADVSGQMLFEWADSCDGWIIGQRYQLDFLYPEAGEVAVDTSYTSWEAKDGSSFQFNLRTMTNGAVDEEIRGSAAIPDPAGNGRAEFRLPEVQAEPLPVGTMFPTAHSLELLERAEAGERFFVAVMFDGTEFAGPIELSAVIGPQAPAPEAASAAFDVMQRPSWPVRLAFFGQDAGAAAPDYEMELQIYDNGVVDQLLIDYGDFVLRGVLRDLEVLESACP